MVKSPHLVSEYLEDLAGEILEFPDVVEGFVAGRPGIYALYRKGNLYYVGLATNLKARLKQHQKDRHSGKWDRFSVFITTHGDHLKDLESLLLRVTKKPTGNKHNGKFMGARNRNSELKKQFKKQQTQQLNQVFNLVDHTNDNISSQQADSWPLGGIPLRGHFKGREIKARMRKDGTVRIDRTIYTSLSAAASTITGHPTNGRWFWHCKSNSGDWIQFKLVWA